MSLKRDLATANSANLDDEPESSGRKSARGSLKRFVWPEALHRDFIAAVFEIGLKEASPSTLAELIPQHLEVTYDEIRSHIQKFRVCLGRDSSSTYVR